ncbi:MAG: AAA family ATPase [Thermodesulfovibrionia bacterium]|nr:AAA family ATPase [Thermodesulfovibrionia bacterium]
MALKDIIGQEQAIGILRGCVQRNRIAHAYLFAGEDGIGKKLTAINFAKTLNCQNNRNALRVTSNEAKTTSHTALRITHYEIDCCDTCPSCIKINKSSHPDVFFITSTDGQIRVDVIRGLEESLSLKSFEGKWKIAIIDEAEKLNQSAANAFLKTLEEPPEQSLLILVSSMPDFIPKTILSRCQQIKFSPLPLAKMSELLKDRKILNELKSNEEDARIRSMLSGGRLGLTLSHNFIEKRDRLFNDFKTLIGRAEEDSWEGRDSMEEWFEWAHLWIRDIAVLKATGRAEFLINQDKANEIEDISKKAGLHDILKLARTFTRIKDFLRFNVNKRVTLHYTHLLLKKTFG